MLHKILDSILGYLPSGAANMVEKYLPMVKPYVKSGLNYYDSFMAEYGPLVYLLLIPTMLLLGFFGKRWFGYFRSLAFFAAGFVGGYVVLAPYVQTYIPAIDKLVIGASIGVLLAVLSKFIYNAVYVGAIGGAAFLVCYKAYFFEQLESLTKGNVLVSVAVAVAVAAIALLVRKYVEMLGTAVVGGIGFAFVLNEVFVYTTFVTVHPHLTATICGGILAVVMAVYQYVHRLRY